VRLSTARSAFARLSVVEQLQLVQFFVAEAAVFERNDEGSFDLLVERVDGCDLVFDALRQVDDRIQELEDLQFDVSARALAVDDQDEGQSDCIFAAEEQHFLCLSLHVHVENVQVGRWLRLVEFVAECTDVHADKFSAHKTVFLDALADLVRVVDVEQKLCLATNFSLYHFLELGHAQVVVDVRFDVHDAFVF